MTEEINDPIGRMKVAEAELATLKREHEQLRAAAERLLRFYDGVDDGELAAPIAQLRAALDATPAEPAPPPPNSAYARLRAAALRVRQARNDRRFETTSANENAAHEALNAALDANPAEPKNPP